THGRGYRAPFEDAIERRSVSILRRARQPVLHAPAGQRGLQGGRVTHAAGNVLAFDRPRRLEQDDVVGREAEPGPGLVALRRLGRRVEIEAVVDRGRGLVAAGFELAPGTV